MSKVSQSRARRANQKHESLDILKKLQFIGQVQKKDGGIESHSIIRHRRIMASDGVFTLGALIEEDIQACPHTHSLIAAITACRESVGIVMDDTAISVQSGKFKARVQCAPMEAMPVIEPDRLLVPLTNSVKDGFAVISHFAKEGHERLAYATVLLSAQVMTTTNGHAIMQYYHGHDLPTGLIVPKKFCDMVVKHSANLRGFGWSEWSSITFWFDDDTFIKTQLGRGEWPKFDHLFEMQTNPWPLPDGFVEAVETVSGFSDYIVFAGDRISSDDSKATIAYFECNGVPHNRAYASKTFLPILPHIDKMDMKTYDDRMFFYGCDDKMRGIIMGVKRAV